MLANTATIAVAQGHDAAVAVDAEAAVGEPGGDVEQSVAAAGQGRRRTPCSGCTPNRPDGTGTD